MIVSMGMLSYAMKGLPAGGLRHLDSIGAVGTYLWYYRFGESANIYRLLSLAMIVSVLLV